MWREIFIWKYTEKSEWRVEFNCFAHHLWQWNSIAKNIIFQIFGDSSADITSLLEKVCQISGSEMDQTAAKELKWALISDSVSVLASMLAESLRMILEPTIASKLQYVFKIFRINIISRIVYYGGTLSMTTCHIGCVLRFVYGKVVHWNVQSRQLIKKFAKFFI